MSVMAVIWVAWGEYVCNGWQLDVMGRKEQKGYSLTRADILYTNFIHRCLSVFGLKTPMRVLY